MVADADDCAIDAVNLDDRGRVDAVRLGGGVAGRVAGDRGGGVVARP